MSLKDTSYWQRKISAWTNESVCKIFDIANRKEKAKEIRDILPIKEKADEDIIFMAEHISSGLTRAALPYDDSKIDEIVLKHPLVKDKTLTFKNPINDCEQLVDEVKNLISNDLTFAKDLDDTEKYKQIFNYLFFALNISLRNTKEGEIGKLGALWDILPADTRMPDHPMWHHLGLTSAIYSSLEANTEKNKENLSIVVYSITPVQDFIMKARKLRDYWTGSVILSYLAFSGITAVIEELGPDHILYPSLHNQALMEQWLYSKNNKFETLLSESSDVLKSLNKKSKSIASFPNKFVFICNNKDVSSITSLIENTIQASWKEIANIVKEYISKHTDIENNDIYDSIWSNTIDKYWKYSWAATNFATIHNEKELTALLPKSKWNNELNAMQKFDEYFRKKGTVSYDVTNLYGSTHSLVQGLLAAGKNKPIVNNLHNTQTGLKCPLCGENEVLNSSPKNIKASEYNNNIIKFWNKLGTKVNPKDSHSQIGEKECLCAVCSLKRFLPLAIPKTHILYNTLKESDKFPSTTEMSAHEFLKTIPSDKRQIIIDKLHDTESSVNKDTDTILKGAKGFETKYYAFLLMDGDKMGDLINGETTEASWEDVLNIKTKEGTPFVDKTFREERRSINPALHSMISDSLNNFARYGVQPLVDKIGEGQLIYAGGDDVCAILPLSTAFETADKIRQIYSLSYANVTKDGSNALIKGEQGNENNIPLSPNMDKIVMHLGHSNNQANTKISLSGAIIIAHHKQPLKEVIMDAHKVLDGIAKEKSNRNSLAIRLKKRSGGSRDVWFKWDEENIFADDKRSRKTSFLNIMNSVGQKELSTSLLYGIQGLKGYIEPFIAGNNSFEKLKENKYKILKLFEYELMHSGYINNASSLAIDIAGICININSNKISDDWYNPEAVVIANFMGNKTIKTNLCEGGDND